MEHEPLEDDIPALLRRAQAAEGAVEEFVRIHCFEFTDGCKEALIWQRTEGRRRVLAGGDPEVIREETERRIAEARATFRRKVASLLKWGEESGRV